MPLRVDGSVPRGEQRVLEPGLAALLATAPRSRRRLKTCDLVSRHCLRPRREFAAVIVCEVLRPLGLGETHVSECRREGSPVDARVLGHARAVLSVRSAATRAGGERRQKRLRLEPNPERTQLEYSFVSLGLLS